MAGNRRGWGGRRGRPGRTMHPGLRAIILKSGLTMEQLSEISGVLPQVMFAWVTGRTVVPKGHPAIDRLCAYFGVTPAVLKRASTRRRQVQICEQKHERDDDGQPTENPPIECPPPPDPQRHARGLCVPDCPDDCPWRITRKDGDRCPFYVRIPWPRKWGCQFYLCSDPGAQPRTTLAMEAQWRVNI